MEAGITDSKIAIGLSLFDQLIVGILKQTFKVDQMLKIFQMLHLFLKYFYFSECFFHSLEHCGIRIQLQNALSLDVVGGKGAVSRDEG